jgi:hypothetical protein
MQRTPVTGSQLLAAAAAVGKGPAGARSPDIGGSRRRGRHRGPQQPADRILRALTRRPARRGGHVWAETHEEWQQRRLSADHPGWTIKVTSERATAQRGGEILTALSAVELRITLDQLAGDSALRLW